MLVPAWARATMKCHSRYDRLGEQADRDVDALAIAAGQAPELFAAALAKPGLLEHQRYRSLGVGDPLEPGEQAQVLDHREL